MGAISVMGFIPFAATHLGDGVAWLMSAIQNRAVSPNQQLPQHNGKWLNALLGVVWLIGSIARTARKNRVLPPTFPSFGETRAT
ncbi:hypothetical protein KCP77_12030 [Salmonella enterica subsp. enterica]|nr:hypothetical protein KCP77_12030 [Salmonella enterica subsp. enterica]